MKTPGRKNLTYAKIMNKDVADKILVNINQMENTLRELRDVVVESIYPCEHQYKQVYPNRHRDNGEVYYSCTKCGYQE